MHNCAGNNSQFLQLDHCRDLCQTFLRTSLADVIPEVSARMAFSWISDFLADSPPSLAVCEVSVLSRVAMQQDCAWLFFIPWFMSSAYDDRVIELITKLWTWEVSLTCRQVCSLCPKWLDALGTLSCFLWKLYKLVRGWVGHVVITDLWVLSGDSWPRTSFWSEKLQTWLLTYMQRGDADDIAAIPFFAAFCGNISVQLKDDWTHSLTSFPLSFLLIDPLALLNAKGRRDFCVMSVRT